MEFATGAMGTLIPKLGELLLDEYNLKEKVKKGIVDLKAELEAMQAALVKVSSVPFDQLDAQVRIWATDVRELSYAIEDSLHSSMVRIDGLEPTKPKMKHLLKKARDEFTKFKARREIANDIKTIESIVRKIKERYDRFDIFVIPESSTVDPRLLALYNNKVSDLVGTDEPIDELMKILSQGAETPQKNLKIVSIVGVGGLGKTTLAKALYDKISKTYECRSFVLVGQNQGAKKVLRDILFELDRELYIAAGRLDERQLINQLQEVLAGKRYLIVIDDIWDQDLWENIKLALPNENNFGSRIITTTRIISVAKACCSSANDSVYQMEPLSDVDSRKLFSQRLFDSEGECHPSFDQVPGDMMKKCGGLPLAIILTCSVLVGKRPEDWGIIECTFGRLETEVWKNMRRIMSFSYYDLPRHLRTCLLYFCTFPGSNAIEGDRLVKKWIVEGIVTQGTKLFGLSNKKEDMLSFKQKLSLEETASKCLDELVNRNVIHPLECNNNFEVITYHIHPMMLAVLKAIAIEEKFAASVDEKDMSSEDLMFIPHISINCPDSENLIHSSRMVPAISVRSLTIFGHANRLLRWKFKAMRVLDLEGCKSIEKAELEYICSMVLLKQLCLAKTQITELPPQIGDLQNLEGLDIGGTQITELPTQISKLQQLKTLDARKSGVKEIPDQVVQLIGLVHLLIGDSESSEGVKLPDGIGKLILLEKLCTIDLRKCSASSLKELGELPCLKEIVVVGSHKLEGTKVNNALLSSLEKSTELRSVVVYGDYRLSTLEPSFPYNYLDCRQKLTLVRRYLKVPIYIARVHLVCGLDIRVCKLEEDDLKILRELPRLQSLIVRFEIIPGAMVHISCEGFAKLESFCVDCRMPRVIFEVGAMPKLKHLELRLSAGSASEKHMGIKHLLNLQEVRLQYFNWYAANKCVKDTTDAVKNEAKEHQNEITVSIAVQNKDGTCTMMHEIFPENKDAGCSKMTETEDEDGHADGTGYLLDDEDTQEGARLQSSCAIANSSGTNEIEEAAQTAE